MKKHTLLATLLLSALLTLSISCEKKTDRQQANRNVVITTVAPLSGSSSTDYPGIIEEGSSISASFMADGKISRINVKEGDRVRKGQLLATLDDSDYRIGVAQLEAQLAQMTKEKERMDAMFDKHNIAPNDYEKFQTGYEQLKLQLEMAKRQLGYTRLYSPADGYVAAKYMNEGELVGAGTPVVNIVDDTQLVASVDLPVSAYLEKSKIQTAEGRVPGIEMTVPLKIISFTPDAENNMLYHMKLAVPAAAARELTPGMNISVSLGTSEEGGAETMVPSRAIMAADGDTFVWTLDERDSTIHRTPVQIDGGPVGKMNVVRGLKLGDKVVETGVKQLHEGEKVNILNREDLGI